jgi:hypothetical protein
LLVGGENVRISLQREGSRVPARRSTSHGQSDLWKAHQSEDSHSPWIQVAAQVTTAVILTGSQILARATGHHLAPVLARGD